jgi:hypothetical protein
MKMLVSLSLRVKRGGPISLLLGCVDKRGFVLAGCLSMRFVFVLILDAYTEAFWSA